MKDPKGFFTYISNNFSIEKILQDGSLVSVEEEALLAEKGSVPLVITRKRLNFALAGKKQLVFIHTQKTAGMTVNTILKGLFDPEDSVVSLDAMTPVDELQNSHRYVRGHFFYYDFEHEC